MALDAEVRALSNPVSADAYPVAGGIEDHASNGPMVVQRVARIVECSVGVERLALSYSLKGRTEVKKNFAPATNVSS